MQIHIDSSSAENFPGAAVAVLCFETGSDPALAAQSGWLADIRSAGEFTGKSCEISLLYRPQGLGAKWLAVAGAGKREQFSAAEARKAAGALVRTLKGKGIRALALLAPEPYLPSEIEAMIEGAILGDWEPSAYKSEKDDKQFEAFTILVPGATNLSALQNACEHARLVAESQNLARELVNQPPNKLNPAALAQAARQMAAEDGLECEVLDREAMAKLGMGALLGVAQGSINPPFLIALKYRPSHSSGTDHLALIGKGVTFDTGGISIKHADGMEKMKYDMAGAAAVIGAMRATAHLKPAIPVTGYIPTVENMLGGNAQRPGDIVTSLSGKTIEVLNTDAEGRLILADAIAYAKRNGATHLVDAATLTGAIGIALGAHNMGAFTNEQSFCDRLLAAVRAAGEKAWQLPLEDEYRDSLKSAFADLPNISGNRQAGATVAAWFLREFADPTPWVHLDIASTAWLDDAKPWMAKGPTGVGVRSFIKLAADWGR